ncbi:hypothetical protein [Herbaspirillum sp.]|uniref:hypothetical protein n=1 Tax=Herbaspirillum sp. TaxID=1890675 RepID=UPI001B1FD97C|nr:hypothetical protein [Herbaspirillum sp.]MBO9538906.1 hypothetical protein [Herbaspirillum sp.]
MARLDSFAAMQINSHPFVARVKNELDAAIGVNGGKKCCVAKDLPLSGIMFPVSPLKRKSSLCVFR